MVLRMAVEARVSKLLMENVMRVLKLAYHCFRLQTLIQVNFCLKSERVTASPKVFTVHAMHINILCALR